MSDSNKISFRLSPPLQTALTAYVRQHRGHVSDIMREALETYLGLRPTERPTAPAPVSDMSDVMAKLTALVSDGADLRNQLAALDARETRPSRIRQRPTKHQTPRPTRPTGQPGIPPETLQAIAEARQQYPYLTLPELARLLYYQHIYQARGKDGQARPVDHSRLRRWLAQAREAGLLS